MNGYKAYKYFLTCKLHFTRKNFNVFHGSTVKYTLDNFLKRNDRVIFERLAKKYDTSRELIDFYVSNFARGLDDFVYLPEEGENNYKAWLAYKQSFTYRFKTDLAILESCVELSNKNFTECVWQSYTTGKIDLQSIYVLNEVCSLLDRIEEANSLLFEDEVLRIKKLKGFLKIPGAVEKEAREFIQKYEERNEKPPQVS